jgi:hypothetical protein
LFIIDFFKRLIMLYIHDASCISSQHTFPDGKLDQYSALQSNKIAVTEPSYPDIPEKILRRMGKAVRLGVGAAISLIKKSADPDGIIIGTANGGMEDCIKFLNQIIEYDEGVLTPTNFVQSTANAIAGQVGLMLRNKGYNITHVHKGHAFENALLDASLHLAENPGAKLLVGAVDEISAYNYNIDLLAGWFKDQDIPATQMYNHHSAGSWAGEGSAMFIVSDKPTTNAVKLVAIQTITCDKPALVKDALERFISQHNSAPDIFMSGENGDSRLQPFYDAGEAALANIPVVRFKHLSGEYGTASGFALWAASVILKTQNIPGHMWKTSPDVLTPRSILIYNNHKGLQHSFLLCSNE